MFIVRLAALNTTQRSPYEIYKMLISLAFVDTSIVESIAERYMETVFTTIKLWSSFRRLIREGERLRRWKRRLVGLQDQLDTM